MISMERMMCSVNICIGIWYYSIIIWFSWIINNIQCKYLWLKVYTFLQQMSFGLCWHFCTVTKLMYIITFSGYVYSQACQSLTYCSELTNNTHIINLHEISIYNWGTLTQSWTLNFGLCTQNHWVKINVRGLKW